MKAHSRFANYKFSRFENYATYIKIPIDAMSRFLISFAQTEKGMDLIKNNNWWWRRAHEAR